MKERYRLVAVAALGVAVRFIVLVIAPATPYKPVDVYYSGTQGTKVLLSLQNPYTHTYSPNAGDTQIFAYLPMVPIFLSPFVLLGDARYGGIFADFVTIFSCFWIAKTSSPIRGIYAPMGYALLPISIWLTSISGTNSMVGSMFLMLAFASMLKEKYLLTSIFLGLGLAANQLIILSLPFFGYYLFRNGKLFYLLSALVVTLVVVLPFYIASPNNFVYDVGSYQLTRPLQGNGEMSLYALVYNISGLELLPEIRWIIVTVACILLLRIAKTTGSFLAASAALIAIGAFVLPINTFWNYFLLPIAIVCSLIPSIIQRMERANVVRGEEKRAN